MANTRQLRQRIKSVKNTSQITKAMQMVAATKMRRAQTQAISGRPYTVILQNALERLTPGIHPEAHPLLFSNGVTQKGMLVLSTNKALCGALNTNLFRAIQLFIGQNNRHPERSEGSPTNVGKSGTSPEIPRYTRNDNVKFFSVGLKGKNFILQTQQNLEGDFENAETIRFIRAKQIADLLIKAYLKKQIGEVYLSYPHFVSTLKQEPRIVKLLPINNVILNVSEGSPTNVGKSGTSPEIPRYTRNDSSEFLFEPNADELLDSVLTHHIETQIYQALLETKASEHSARMMAMQNATDNAKELVERLNLTYNKTRQSAITAELLEITTAAAALE